MSYKQEMGSKEIYSDGTFNKKTVDLINSSALGDPNSKSNNSFSVSGLDLKSSGLNVGDQFNFGNTLGSITDLEDNSTPDYTVPGFSGSKDFKSAFGAARSGGLKEFEFGGKKYNTNLSTDPDFGKDTVVQGTSGFTGKYNSPGTPDVPEVKVDAFSNLGRRGQVRGIKTGTAAEKRNTMKAARNDAKGIKGKNIFETLKLRKEFTKKARINAKTKMTTDRASQFKAVNEQRKLQNEQGINHRVGKKNRVVTQKGVKGTSSTPANSSFVSFDQFVKNKKNS
jgi:hypothetical protein